MGLFQRLFTRPTKVAGWTKSRRKATHADGYSVEVKGVAREAVSIIYRDGSKATDLSGELCGPRWQQISARVPDEMPADEISQIVPRVAAGLRALEFGFEIVRYDAPVPIPESERDAARQELRAMGFEPEIQPGGSIRFGAPVHRPGSKEEAKEQALRMSRAVQSLAKTRRPRIVLARSDG